MLSREGGVEVVVNELATRMVGRGYNVTCYDRRAHHVSGEGIDKRSEYKGVKIIPVWTIEKKGLAAMTSSFSAALRSTLGQYDIVHIHAEGPAALSWLPKIRKKKVIVTIHGLDWARAKWGRLAKKYIKWGEWQAVKHADHIIVLSQNIQKYFEENYGRETEFIPNGVNRHEKQEAEIIWKRWGLKKDSYVLFLGRIVPEKGLHYLIEAWNGIDTDKKLVIAGGSSDTQGYVNEMMKNSSENVIFVGFQQGRVLEELYSNCFVYVLPSDLEGMPLSLLEAMSYGNCCVVSDIEECVEVVRDKAIVFPRGNVEELKKILQLIINEPEIVQKYKRGAADYICKKYNWDDVVEKTLRVYAGSLNNGQ